MLVTTTLSFYYLPRLAEIRSSTDLKTEIIKVYSIVMPVVIVSVIMIYFLRDFIIHILFTPDFFPMRELFPWQLAGDVLKVGSWVLAYIMLGRAMAKIFIITEIVFSILFVVLSYLMVSSFGLVGVPMAYSINYFFYWVAMGYLMQSEMKRMDQ